MYDFSTPPPRRQIPVNREHSFNVSDLPKRSRSVMNISSASSSTHHHHHTQHTFKKHCWVLPESPTVSETQSQLKKRHSLSGALSPSTPKVPHIRRFLEMFTKLKASYGAFLKVLQELNRSELTPKENILFEKCLRKFQSRVKKIHDLKELYIHQEHMREGAQNLLHTMERENSKKIRERIYDVKANYKKNIDRLCAVEDEINSIAGHIKIQIIGLIGFARLSSGDVYTVQCRHGYDKVSAKCKVVGQGQKWTNASVNVPATFKVCLLHDFKVKVIETQKINSNTVGVVTCPIGNFISTEQEFVLPVNSTGTLKLKISAVWSPLTNKEETAFSGKITINEFTDSGPDSCSVKKASSTRNLNNGTLSSMPKISCAKGTLSPMKISIDGGYFSPPAGVIRHCQSNEETPINMVQKEGDESKWAFNTTSQSMPDLTVISTNHTSSVDGEKDAPNPSTTVLNGGLEESTVKKIPPEVKKKPQPVSLNPSFTSPNKITSRDYPDYENVEYLYKGSTEKQNTEKYEQSDETLALKQQTTDFPVSNLPSPDYSPPTSPPKEPPPGIPVIYEVDYTDAQSSESNTISVKPDYLDQESIECSMEIVEPDCVDDQSNKSKIQTEETTVTKVEATSSPADVNTATEVIPVTIINGIASIEIGGDNLTSASIDKPIKSDEDEDESVLSMIQALVLQIAVKIAEFPEELRSEMKSLQDVIHKLSNLFQESNKQPLGRSASVEKALESIDSAFDFLLDHQTLKNNRSHEESTVQIYPQQLAIVKVVLLHHLLCCGNLLKLVKPILTPLKVKAEKYNRELMEQTAILETLTGYLTSLDEISSDTVYKSIEGSDVFEDLWSKSSKENELFCSPDQLLEALKAIELRGHNPSEEVCLCVLDRVRSSSRYSPQSDIVSVFQCANFFTRIAKEGLVLFFETVQKELRCLRALNSRDDLVVLSAIQDRKMIPIVQSCLQRLALLLTNKNKTVQKAAANFLVMIANSTKVKATAIYVEMLESEFEADRVGACHAIGCLEAESARDQIAYAWKNDEKGVRNAAFEALKVVGFPDELRAQSINRSSGGYTEVATRL
eukprot:gene16878-18583_t